MSLSTVRVLNGELDKMLDGSGVRWETVPACETIEGWGDMLRRNLPDKHVSLTEVSPTCLLIAVERAGVVVFKRHIDGEKDHLFAVKVSSLRQGPKPFVTTQEMMQAHGW